MTEQTNIQQEEKGSKGSFFVEINGERKAEMTYSMAGAEKLIIDHTEVSDDLRGQNVGKRMVMAAVEWARQNNLKILPLCPFARSVFRKTQEIHDVLV